MRKAVEELLESVKDLTRDSDPGRTLQRTCQFLRDSVDHYDWVGFYLVVPGERLLVLGPFAGEPTEHLKIPFGTGICGQAAERGSVFVVPDVTAQANYLSCSINTKAEIVHPVLCQGELVGELDIDSHTFDPFTEEDETLINGICLITAPLVASILRVNQ